MPSSTIDKREMDDLLRRVRGPQLYNRQLSSICQVNGLKSTGVKADLQRRITDRKFALLPAHPRFTRTSLGSCLVFHLPPGHLVYLVPGR